MLGTKILEERKSKYNGNLRVVRSFGLGTYIQSDGLTQSGGIVETFWKQTLKKIKKEKEKVESVLILGLGGGTVVKIVRKNWPEAKITGIDIDPIIVELGKKYLGLNDSNIDIKIADAENFLVSLVSIQDRYDLVIVDLYNGDKFPKKFETKYYIHLVRSLLASPRSPKGESGTVVFNRLYYKDKKIMAEEFGKKLQEVFDKVEVFRPITNIMYICTT
jgi:spermidine synthase